MKIFNGIVEIDKLATIDESKTELYYEPFMVINPITKKDTLPSFDQLYYEYLEKTLEHLLYKYENGWISSPRQIMYNSQECISTVHFVIHKDGLIINVFQRSSNVNNLEEDLQFFNFFIKKHLKNKYEKVDVNYIVSMPHIFKDRRTKVD